MKPLSTVMERNSGSTREEGLLSLSATTTCDRCSNLSYLKGEREEGIIKRGEKRKTIARRYRARLSWKLILSNWVTARPYHPPTTRTTPAARISDRFPLDSFPHPRLKDPSFSGGSCLGSARLGQKFFLSFDAIRMNVFVCVYGVVA